MPTLVFTNTKMRQEADFKNKSAFASIRINEGTYTNFLSCKWLFSLIIAYSFLRKEMIIFLFVAILGVSPIPNSLQKLHNSYKYKGKDW